MAASTGDTEKVRVAVPTTSSSSTIPSAGANASLRGALARWNACACASAALRAQSAQAVPGRAHASGDATGGFQHTHNLMGLYVAVSMGNPAPNTLETSCQGAWQIRSWDSARVRKTPGKRSCRSAAGSSGQKRREQMRTERWCRCGCSCSS